ncbi:MAG: arylsulfatase [Rikenellaceae bacterium]
MKLKKIITSVATVIPMSLLAKNDAPNIIYILADDMGFGDITALDNNCKIATPYLDQLVEDGMSFTDAHTTSSVSTPSRYGIITGRYNWRSSLQTGVTWSYDEPLIEKERVTVATMLSANGYNTGVIGKWHLGLGWERTGEGEHDINFKELNFTPIDNGFDYSYIMSASLDIPPYCYIDGHKVTGEVKDTIERNVGYGSYRRGPIADDFDINTALEHFTQKSLTYIEEKAKDDKPYFLYFPLTAPHTPILPPEEFQGKSGISPYADFVMYVDDIVGRIVEQVKKTGEEDNTIIIFTTDNGCSPAAKIDVLKEHGHYPNSVFRGTKADTYDGGHRIPYIVKWPKEVAAGSECDKPISLASFMATCAEINKIKLPKDYAEDSFSVYDELRGKKSKADSRGEAIVVHHSIFGYFSVRKGDWKLIVCPFSGGWSGPGKNTVTDETPRMQLFNMKDNISEVSDQNLLDEKPEIAQELYAELVWAVENGRTREGAPKDNDVEVVIEKFYGQE